MEKAIHALEMLAQAKSDGHFTVMKFTTDWAVCLGSITDYLSGTNTPVNIHDCTSHNMCHGKTLEEAVCRLIRSL